MRVLALPADRDENEPARHNRYRFFVTVGQLRRFLEDVVRDGGDDPKRPIYLRRHNDGRPILVAELEE